MILIKSGRSLKKRGEKGRVIGESYLMERWCWGKFGILCKLVTEYSIFFAEIQYNEEEKMSSLRLIVQIDILPFTTSVLS